MPESQTLPFDIFILGLRIAFIALIYFFLFQVMRVIVRDLRQGAPAEAPGPRSRYGKLVVVEPGRTRMTPGMTFTLQAVTSLGRKPSNTIVLVEDVASTNGTYLNDAEIARPAALSEGDIVGIGGVRLKWTES
jgi:hypothetical protein